MICFLYGNGTAGGNLKTVRDGGGGAEEVGWHVRKESALDLGRGYAREERSLRGCQRLRAGFCRCPLSCFGNFGFNVKSWLMLF